MDISAVSLNCSLTSRSHASLGVTLTDALDDLISAERIDPQLAIKVLTQFDRIVAESLQEKVKARLTFKVNDARQPSSALPGPRGACAFFALAPCLSHITDAPALAHSEEFWADKNDPGFLGLTRHVSFLRRSLDLPDQECHVQDGQQQRVSHGRQSQDRRLQRKAWR